MSEAERAPVHSRGSIVSHCLRDFGSEPPRTRTWNLEIKSLLLCQLS